MKDKQKAYEEKFDTQLHSWKDLNTGAENTWDEVRTAHPPRGIEVQMSKTTGHAANSRARRLAEAIILQSIEDLWNPMCKKGSLIFFKGDGFELCAEIAGISYIKQLTTLRMLAAAGPIINLRNMRKAL
ncbi:MAG: hypothetical protein RDU01_07205 [Thermodesulfovibrionales bacterium]|nr:hypothetical protein [Thermodesulfovibrionales bacterium]